MTCVYKVLVFLILSIRLHRTRIALRICIGAIFCILYKESVKSALPWEFPPRMLLLSDSCPPYPPGFICIAYSIVGGVNHMKNKLDWFDDNWNWDVRPTRVLYELLLSPTYRWPMRVKEVYSFKWGVEFPQCPRCGTTMEREYQLFCDRCG